MKTGTTGLLILISLSACSPMRSDVPPGNHAPDTAQQPGRIGENQSLGPGLQRLSNLAISDLAGKLGIEAANIDIVEAGYVTWRDSSLGCPRAGTQYMQVLTNGARILLRANGVLYHYHSGGNRAPFHCASPSPNEPLPYAPGEA